MLLQKSEILRSKTVSLNVFTTTESPTTRVSLRPSRMAGLRKLNRCNGLRSDHRVGPLVLLEARAEAASTGVRSEPLPRHYFAKVE
jgi:hypothetical protein